MSDLQDCSLRDRLPKRIRLGMDDPSALIVGTWFGEVMSGIVPAPSTRRLDRRFSPRLMTPPLSLEMLGEVSPLSQNNTSLRGQRVPTELGYSMRRRCWST